MKKKAFRERVKHISIRPYGATLTLVVSSDIFESWWRRRKRCPTARSPHRDADAFCWTRSGDSRSFAFLPEKCGLGTTAHEMQHIVSHVMHDTGVGYNDEVWSYHLGELTQMAAEFVHAKESNKYRDPK